MLLSLECRHRKCSPVGFSGLVGWERNRRSEGEELGDELLGLGLLSQGLGVVRICGEGSMGEGID